jgi:hypothetical protein
MRWVVLALVVAVGIFVLAEGFGATDKGAAAPAGSPGAVATSPSSPARHTTTPPPSASAKPDLKNTTVAVYNSTGTPNLAGGEQTRLKHAGVNVVSIGDAHPLFTKTTIYYTDAGKQVAQYLHDTFYPSAVVKPVQKGTTFATTDVSIVLGSDFTG